MKFGYNVSFNYSKSSRPRNNFIDFYRTPSFLPVYHNDWTTALTGGYTGFARGSHFNGIYGPIGEPDEYGNPTYNTGTTGLSPFSSANNNPKSVMANTERWSENMSGVANAYIEIKLAKGLTFKSSNGFNVRYQPQYTYSNKNATKKQTDTNTRERTDNVTNNTDTTVTNNLQTSSTESTSNDEEEGIAAFNSTDYSNSTKNTKSGSAEESVTNTGTVGTDSEQTSNGTTNESVNGTTDVTDTSNESATEKRAIIRKGNIGNMTFADIISGERTMLAYQLFDTIYADLDSILTRGMYM